MNKFYKTLVITTFVLTVLSSGTYLAQAASGFLDTVATTLGLHIEGNAGVADNLYVGEKVGIGTVNPTESLDIVGKVKTTNGVVFGDGSVQTTAYIENAENLESSRNYLLLEDITTQKFVSIDNGDVKVGSECPFSSGYKYSTIEFTGAVFPNGNILFTDKNQGNYTLKYTVLDQNCQTVQSAAYIDGSAGYAIYRPQAIALDNGNVAIVYYKSDTLKMKIYNDQGVNLSETTLNGSFSGYGNYFTVEKIANDKILVIARANSNNTGKFGVYSSDGTEVVGLTTISTDMYHRGMSGVGFSDESFAITYVKNSNKNAQLVVYDKDGVKQGSDKGLSGGSIIIHTDMALTSNEDIAIVSASEGSTYSYFQVLSKTGTIIKSSTVLDDSTSSHIEEVRIKPIKSGEYFVILQDAKYTENLLVSVISKDGTYHKAPMTVVSGGNTASYMFSDAVDNMYILYTSGIHPVFRKLDVLNSFLYGIKSYDSTLGKPFIGVLKEPGNEGDTKSVLMNGGVLSYPVGKENMGKYVYAGNSGEISYASNGVRIGTSISDTEIALSF